jgi:hypothetical protein
VPAVDDFTQALFDKGHDLEDLILEKGSKMVDIEFEKPTEMFYHPDTPMITANMDGLNRDLEIGAECKYVSQYGEAN